MDFSYQIDSRLDVPIYRQLVDKIRAGVKGGELPGGSRLPTVQELADSLSVARGTVKRAYDELERMGLVEKIQGRGTYVRRLNPEGGGRKEQAMRAIDALLDKLEQMDFSPAEVNIYLDLKLRQRAQQLSRVKVGVLQADPETLSQMSEQLRAMKQVEVFSYRLDSVVEYPYKLEDELDLIVTTAACAEALEAMPMVKKKLVLTALRPGREALRALLRLPKNAHVGILAYSDQFAARLEQTCLEMGATPAQPRLISHETGLEEYLKAADAVLLPAAYKKYCPPGASELLRRFAQTKKLIPCSYRMDEGSVLYLTERIDRTVEEKML